MKTLVLDGTAISIQVAMSTSATTTNPTFVASYADNAGSGITEGATDGTLSGSTDVTVVPAPTGSNRRVIKDITIYNADSANVTIFVKYDNNATQRTLAKVVLAAGDTWTTDGTFDSNGALKQTVGTVNLSSGVTGTLTVPNGGTGVATLTGVVKGNGTSAFSAATAGTDYAKPDTSSTWTAAQTFRASNAIRSEAASTQDAVVLAGRAGGTSSYAITVTPTTLSANRTLTLPDASTTIVGTDTTQTLTNKTLTDPAIIGTILEDVYTITDGAAFEIDPGNGSIQLITLGASRTPKATNFAAGEAVTLMVDDGSAYTLTWSDTTFGTSGVVWKTDSGSAPTLNTTGYTVIVLWKVSTQIYGARVGNN